MLVLRRGLSTLIPPKIVSAKQLGATQNAKKVSNMVSFYKALPRAGALSQLRRLLRVDLSTGTELNISMGRTLAVFLYFIWLLVSPFSDTRWSTTCI